MTDEDQVSEHRSHIFVDSHTNNWLHHFNKKVLSPTKDYVDSCEAESSNYVLCDAIEDSRMFTKNDCMLL